MSEEKAPLTEAEVGDRQLTLIVVGAVKISVVTGILLVVGVPVEWAAPIGLVVAVFF